MSFKLGIIPVRLPFAKSNDLIGVFRHALALDERRGEFKVSLWADSGKEEDKCSEDGRLGTYHSERFADGSVHDYVTKGGSNGNPNRYEHNPDTQRSNINGRQEYRSSLNPERQTDVKGEKDGLFSCVKSPQSTTLRLGLSLDIEPYFGIHKKLLLKRPLSCILTFSGRGVVCRCTRRRWRGRRRK